MQIWGSWEAFRDSRLKALIFTLLPAKLCRRQRGCFSGDNLKVCCAGPRLEWSEKGTSWKTNTERKKKKIVIKINNGLIQYVAKVKINAEIHNAQNIKIVHKDSMNTTKCNITTLRCIFIYKVHIFIYKYRHTHLKWTLIVSISTFFFKLSRVKELRFSPNFPRLL